ncbi:MAG: glycosyltransferase, partial [Bryobacteraceae bacterium]
MDHFRQIDYVVTVSERQKYFWSAYCSLAGFSFADLNVLVCPVSFEIPPVTRSTSPEMSVVYSGGFYPWQNPERFLRAAAAALDEVEGATFHIFGGPHAGLPNEAEVNALLSDLQSHRCVQYHGYRPVEELLSTLSSAWCALELMEQSIERELAITGRTVEFLASGTPVIYNNYSTLSGLIEKYKAGWTMPTSDPGALKPVIEALRAGGPALVDELSRNARKLASAEFNAEKNMEPLVKSCEGAISKRVKSTRPSRRAVGPAHGTQSIGKVLGISPDTFALVELRVNNPLRALQRQGLIGGFETTGIHFERLKEDRSFYEAAMIQRTVPRSIYQTLTNLGLPFAMDMDDNLLASASYRAKGSEEVEAIAGLRHASVITTPNPRLIRMLEKYSGLPLSRKAYMTPNALPFPELTREPSKPEKIFWIQSDIAALTASRENVVRAVEDFSRRHALPVVLIGPNVLDRPKFTNQVLMG